MNAADGLDRIALLLQRALDGDASTIHELRGVSQAALNAAGDQLGGRLSFDRPTLLRVLMDWRAGRVTEDQARGWALLMFIGGFPDTRSHVSESVHATWHPIDVDYSDDDAVNDIVFELKDLGEPVDGIITSAERNEMIERLERSPKTLACPNSGEPIPPSGRSGPWAGRRQRS